MKFYKLLGAAAALGCFFAMSTMAMAFSDVPEDHPNHQAIMYLNEAGVIDGYPDGTFKPEQTVNRVEALKILLLGAGIDVDSAPSQVPFTDVEAGQWYFPFLATAVGRDVVNGYPDGTFKPGQEVNLVEAMKMAILVDGVNMYDFDMPSSGNILSDPFVDSDAGQWYNEYMWFARVAYLIEVDREGKVYPGEGVSRGKLAEIMFRLIWIREQNETRALFEQNPILSYRHQLSLDNLDQDNGSDAFDFEAGWTDIDFPSNDMWMGSLSINGFWTRSMDWQVVEMSDPYFAADPDVTAEEVFDMIKVCPEDGYASIDNPDEDGFGQARTADFGKVYCLRTDQGNYAKILVIDAWSENFGDDKYVNMHYVYRADGSRELP